MSFLWDTCSCVFVAVLSVLITYTDRAFISIFTFSIIFHYEIDVSKVVLSQDVLQFKWEQTIVGKEKMQGRTGGWREGTGA